MEDQKNTETGKVETENTTTQQIVEESCEIPQPETPATENETQNNADNKLSELNDRYLRLYSEFENYKRRTAKERVEFAQMAGKEFFLALLPIIDDFERAQKSMEKTEDIVALKEGIDLIYNKLLKTLQLKGLETIQAKETPFDADLHEAITNLPAPTEELKGKVLEELEKGYYLNGKVIRFSKVIVGN